MKIKVTKAKGVLGKTAGGVASVEKEVELEVSDGITISNIWRKAKTAIGLTPEVAPIINRQEIGSVGNTKIVSGDYILQESNIFHLVFV